MSTAGQTAATTNALEANDLAFVYPDGRSVFEAVSLRVDPTEIVAILGASGCGKSTLLRVLAHLERPTRGTIRLHGVVSSAPHPRTALLFQQPSLLPWLSLTANVGFGLDFAHQPAISREVRRQRVSKAITAVGLQAHQRLYPAQLSGGMAQRVAIARALAREPQLLLADEPFSALDPITRADMQSLLIRVVHQWRTAALIVTHDVDEALRVADRVILLGSTEAASAARVLHEWPIDTPTPRRSGDASLMALRAQILDVFQSAHQVSQET